MLIIADEKIPYLKGILEPVADVEYYPGNAINRERIKKADALLIRTRTRCNQELLEGTPVKFIGTATIGFDHIDTPYCERTGISWTNAPGCNSSSVNQYVASALITLSKRFGFSLKERVLGVIGVGNVGKKVVRTAELLSMRVYLNDPPRERREGKCGFLSLDSILRECDILTFHVPLAFQGPDKTFHMVDETFLSKVNPGTIIINSSRGEVVDEPALLTAEKAGLIGGMVLDVWEHEPEINNELHARAAIATPHIAGYSADGKAKGTSMVVQALSRFFNLGYDDWEPENIEQPVPPVIRLDCLNRTVEDILGEALTITYPIVNDDARLRSSPGTFEKQRGEYPLRREYSAYTIHLRHPHSGIEGLLKKLGFEIRVQNP